MAEDIHLPDMERGEGMQEGKLSERALKRSVLRPLQQTVQKKSYNVGDIVNFHGGTHYVSSYAGSRGYNARAGRAKITIKNGSGKAHPWHLIHVDSSSNVYGWVDDGTFD